MFGSLFFSWLQAPIGIPPYLSLDYNKWLLDQQSRKGCVGKPRKAGSKLSRMARQGRLTMKSGNSFIAHLHAMPYA